MWYKQYKSFKFVSSLLDFLPQKNMKVLTVSIFLFSVSFAQIDYTSQIQPIFNQYCVSCHGSSGGLNLTSYAELMKGGNSGASVIAGDVSSSILIQRIDGTINPRMPKDSDALSDSIVSLIKKWINEGAMENVSINGEDPFPSNFKILGNYPNPFNPVTRIVINSDIRVEGRAVITTVSGRTIYDFGAIQLIPGRNSVFWNGEDTLGRRISSGSYIFIFRHSDLILSHNMTLLK